MTEPERRALEVADVPLLAAKEYGEPSVFSPGSLLREARRQRGLPDLAVPDVCVLDPDGDLVRYLCRTDKATKHSGWACYHTDLWVHDLDGDPIGIVGCAVGASFAVLVAEELAESGCNLVISVTSAGRIAPVAEPPYFVLIDRALRDEGTSYHYLPPSEWSTMPAHLVEHLADGLELPDEKVLVGSAWTTDAPFRETEAAIEAATARGILAVEMEAAALYAQATALGHDVVCVAHVTNTMAVDGDDFEKGLDDGAHRTLDVIRAVRTRLKDKDGRHG